MEAIVLWDRNISNNVRIGNGVKIQNNVSVYEGVMLEDYVFCAPSMVFINDLTPRARFAKGSAGYLATVVHHDATIGANATIVFGHEIGEYATIAAGAVVTKDVCVPILERESGLKCDVDFKIGYSPELINPGDKVHRLENISKIVSGMDGEALQEIKNVYDFVIEAGTYPVSSIKTAEAIKVVENSQRDINIVFMNELAMIFDWMEIDTNKVVDGMNTKWNELGFRPGLVGDHCIGVDPYYFTYEAEKLGYHSQIILNGRIVNDGMVLL